MTRTRERQSYNPSDVYRPLIDTAATPEELLNLVIERIKPFVPVHILTGDARKQHIDQMIAAFTELRERYAQILDQSNFSLAGSESLEQVTARVRGGELRDLPSIWREAKAAGAPDEIFERLSGMRDSMDAELLARIGFLPATIFSPEHECEAGPLLQDNVSEHVKSGTDITDKISIAEIRRYAKDMALHQWMNTANADFQTSVADAFTLLNGLSKKVSPHKGVRSQPFDTVSDFGTKHFADFLVLILNPKIALRRRFEALRMLEWAVGFFSVRRNPVYQAQHGVRTAIHDRLEGQFWAPKGQFVMAKLPPDILFMVREDAEQVDSLLAEFAKRESGAGVPAEEPILVLARTVRAEVRAVLGNEFLATNDVIFFSREKSTASTVLKLEILQAMVRRCRAALDGKGDTDMTKKDARIKLRELRDRMRERGHSLEHIKTKLVGFDALDDQVGLSLVVNLRKPLETFATEERGRLSKQFKLLAEYVADVLQLQNVRFEDHLWNKNDLNAKSSKSFNLYKIHGDYEITARVYQDGRLVVKRVSVPIEIQLQPLESFLRVHFDPATSIQQYEHRKAREVAPIAWPEKIGDKNVFLHRTEDGDPNGLGALMDEE